MDMERHLLQEGCQEKETQLSLQCLCLVKMSVLAEKVPSRRSLALYFQVRTFCTPPGDKDRQINLLTQRLQELTTVFASQSVNMKAQLASLQKTTDDNKNAMLQQEARAEFLAKEMERLNEDDPMEMIEKRLDDFLSIWSIMEKEQEKHLVVESILHLLDFYLHRYLPLTRPLWPS